MSELIHVKTWRWFWVRIRYLIRADTALSRHFFPPPPPPEVPTFTGS